MKSSSFFTRFLIPRLFVTFYFLLKYRCIVSTIVEVGISSNLVIGKGSRISSFVKIKASAGLLKIGSSVDIGAGSFLSSGDGQLSIGNDRLIGPKPKCVILANNYNFSRID